MSAEAPAGPWAFAPAAAPFWRPRGRRPRRRDLAWWVAAALHAAALATLLLRLEPETLPEPRTVEGTPLLWEGPVGTGEGAEALSPDLPESPMPAEAAPPRPAPSPPEAAPAPAEPPPPAEAPAAAAPAQPPAAEAAPAPPPLSDSPAETRPTPPARRPPAPPNPAAGPLPLPMPPAPPPPPRASPAPPAPAAAPPAVASPAASPAAAPAATPAERQPAAGSVRLDAGTAGAPGESRVVGAPQAGCQDAIGYPPSERQRGITGAVGLRLRVSEDGRVVEVRLVEPSGSFALDDAAQRGIRRCRFVPALRDGIPVRGSRDYRVVFRLD
ncbi:energy transducer TonB [Roseomonas sp. GCM10028921]